MSSIPADRLQKRRDPDGQPQADTTPAKAHAVKQRSRASSVPKRPLDTPQALKKKKTPPKAKNLQRLSMLSQDQGNGEQVVVEQSLHNPISNICAQATPKNVPKIQSLPTPSASPEPEFRAFGLPAHPTLAKRNEICNRFLNGRCSNGTNCSRIHPLEKQNKLTKLAIPSQDLLSPHSEATHTAVPPNLNSPDKQHVQSPVAELSSQTSPLNPTLGTTNPRFHNITSSQPASSMGTEARHPLNGKSHNARPPKSWIIPQSSGRISSSRATLQCSPELNFLPPRTDTDTGQTSDSSMQESSVCFSGNDSLYSSVQTTSSHSSVMAEPTGSQDPPPSSSRFSGVLVPSHKTSSQSIAVDNSQKEKKLENDQTQLETQTQLGVYIPRIPRPRGSPVYCRRWLLNKCTHGPLCDFVHGDVEYDPPINGILPRPKYPSICRLWLHDQCYNGYACEYTHEDLKYDDEKQENQSRRAPSALIKNDGLPVRMPSHPGYPDMRFKGTHDQYLNRGAYKHPHDGLEGSPSLAFQIFKMSLNHTVFPDPPAGKRPRPKNANTCIRWLRDKCPLRYACKYTHGDLDYDPPREQHHNLLPLKTNNHPIITPVSGSHAPWSLTVHDHAKVKLGPGFEVQEVTTGFETPWVYLGNIPASTSVEDIMQLLQPHGDVLDVKLPSRNSSHIVVKARFSTPAEARKTSTALNGSQAFGHKITARLPAHDATGYGSVFEDTAVRIRWEAPSKVGYGGYSTVEHANKALAAARIPFRDHCIHASVYVGLPVVGVVTVRFRGLPLDANVGDMERFAHPNDVVWERPNYQDFSLAVRGIKRILESHTQLLDFAIQPPPYKNGAIVQAWAHFSTPSDAKAVCNQLHGRRPIFTGKTRIVAQHVQSLTFSLSPTIYNSLGSDIYALSCAVYRGRQSTMSVIHRAPPQSSLVRLSGDDLKELGQLKAELEKILNWEIVRQGNRVIWDAFFAQPAGNLFLQNIQREYSNVIVRNDPPRRMIRLLGSSKQRDCVRKQILEKIDELRTQQIRSIPLDRSLIGAFMTKDLIQLQNRFGPDNILLDLLNGQLRVRGNDAVLEVAREAVEHFRQLHRTKRRRNISGCPVCFEKVTKPETLLCGHSWCHTCISHYLISSIDNKYFPLKCLGDEGKCSRYIPLNTAQKVLTKSQFDDVVDAAFASYVQSRPDDFHYCPSPDCPQIYRPAPRGTVLQCPSCLIRICPNCHVEAHDGFACPNPDGETNLFKEWMKAHDVKPCPGCKIPIERAEGCNHMTCTQCKTHICWVCMQTFPGGDGIYDHMRALHGGIGLGPEN